MRTLVAGLFVALLFATALPAARADRGAEEVLALVTVRFDPDSRAVVWPEVQAVLQSSPREGWSGEAPAVLAQTPDTYREVRIEREDADESGVLSFRVAIESKDASVRADRLLEALIRGLEAHVAERARAENDRRDQELQRLRARLDALTGEIAEVREEGALPWPLSATTFFETLLDRRHEVRGRLLDLEVDHASLTAREKVLTDRLTQMRAEAAKRQQAIVAAWDDIVASREKILAQEKSALEKGQGHPIDVAAAEESLARARLEREGMMGDPTALPLGSRLAEIEGALETVRLDLQVMGATRAQLEQIHQQLDERIKKRRSDVLRATYREEELRVLRDRVLELTEQIAAARAPEVSRLRLD